MKRKRTIPNPSSSSQPNVMRIADLLSNDPMLIGLLGPKFKVLATYDAEAKRVTYSFRRQDDNDPSAADGRMPDTY